MDLSQRLDEMELAIHKPSFRKGTGRANEVNYWVFDYPPEKELEVRERVEYLKIRTTGAMMILSLWSLTCMISSLTFWKRKTSWKSAMTLKKARNRAYRQGSDQLHEGK